MIDRLPIEIVYHILSYVPFSSYTKLYQSLPKQIIDEALFLKLKQAARFQQGLLELVSTNLHELNAPYHYSLKNFSKLGYPNNIINNKKVNNNESFIPLYFRYMDIKHQLLWFTPDIKSMNYYFEVKDFYVSHGKLVLRQKQETVTSANATQQKVIGSLWDIRNKFPSTRSGNFSGAASNYNSSTAASSINNPTNTQFIKITMDTSSPPSSSPSSHSTNNTNNINNNNKHDKSLLMKKKMSSTILLDACCVLGLEDDKQKIVNQVNDPSTYCHNDPPRPSLYLDHHHLYLPKTVSQQISSPWHTTFTCGYFVIEQVGISISEFLDFF
ncbi:hypothetical protein BJ944DRAFT_261374 [Cunninghamella echinulata]|nr:hypothetical protein BJ944DRAFT_261374 [Cunninghamella echinulata]